MNIAELIEISLADSGGRRVEVAALEPAELAMEAVSELAQLLAELVGNSIAFSQPDDTVRVTGLFDQDSYLISISDRGIGIPEPFITELNRFLAEPAMPGGPAPKMGIALVARLAARHGIEVRLVPGVPGTTARVTIPARLVTPPPETPGAGLLVGDRNRLPPRPRASAPLLPETEPVFASSPARGDTVDLTRFEGEHDRSGGVIAMSEGAKREAETFLAKVFAPLVGKPGGVERPRGRPAPSGSTRPDQPQREMAAPTTRQEGGTVTELRVRVPGENFALVRDEPSTVAAESAIDIRSALSRYEQGRRSAGRAEADEG